MKHKILIAADHAGFKLKEKLKIFLLKEGFQIKDEGTHTAQSCDYPEFAYKVAQVISKGKYKRGVLICKTGIGNSMVANKFPRVRAALCYNTKAARLSREHNDSNILVLGSAFVNESLARRILEVWLHTKFMEGRHRRRLNKLRKIERQIRCKRK